MGLSFLLFLEGLVIATTLLGSVIGISGCSWKMKANALNLDDTHVILFM